MGVWRFLYLGSLKCHSATRLWTATSSGFNVIAVKDNLDLATHRIVNLRPFCFQIYLILFRAFFLKKINILKMH